MLATCSVVLFLVQLCVGGALKDVDVELIPKEQRTAGTDVGRSLSLGLDNFELDRYDLDEVDQRAASSAFYPSVQHTGGGYGYSDSDQLQKERASYRQEDAGGARGEVGFYGAAGRKGSSARVNEDGYAGDHKAAHGDQVDSGYYDSNSGIKKGYDMGHASYGDQAYNRRGQAAVVHGARGGHRKGHHSSGFSNSYHKDESGNNSRFYDDASDIGGYYDYGAREGLYSDHGGNKHHGAYEDGAYQDDARGQRGKYGSAVSYDDAHGYKGQLARDDFYDDKTGYGQRRSGEHFQKNLQGDRNQEAGSLYHSGGEHGRNGHYEPSVVKGYVTNNYNPKSYYPEASYPVPYSFYKGKADVIADPLYDTDIKGKGYAEYEDTGLKNYYGNKRDATFSYHEPDYL